MRRIRKDRPGYHPFGQIIGVGRIRLGRCRECGNLSPHLSHVRIVPKIKVLDVSDRRVTL